MKKRNQFGPSISETWKVKMGLGATIVRLVLTRVNVKGIQG